MTILHAVLLSVVEGVTEFLPVSSTGHLVLVSKLLAIPTSDFSKSFDIVIQFGAILAVISLYWKTIIRKPTIIVPVAFAFLPTALVGLLSYTVIKNSLLTNELVIVVSLALGGVVLVFLDRFIKKSTRSNIVIMPLTHAVIIGIGQSFAVIPGVSRAAATVVTALLLGYDRTSAVEFSFLLAIPTIGAAAGLDVVKNYHALFANLPLLTIGFIGSWITALIAVRGFVGYMKQHSLAAFGWYRILVATLFWLMIGI